MFKYLSLLTILAACNGKEDDTAGTTDTDTDTTSDLATCADYCTAYFANCADEAATDYTDDDGCQTACAAWDQGSVGATSGDSLECRVYHTDAAATDPTTHCTHAGANPSAGGCL